MAACAIAIEDDLGRVVGFSELCKGGIGQLILACVRAFRDHFIERQSDAHAQLVHHCFCKGPMLFEHRQDKPATMKIEHMPFARSAFGVERDNLLACRFPFIDVELGAEALGHWGILGELSPLQERLHVLCILWEHIGTL